MIPPEPTAPETLGTQPRNASEVNSLVGSHLRGFAASKVQIGQSQDWLVTVDLTAAPYYFTTVQQTLIKSAFADLDAALDAVNMTFISQLIGM